MTLATHTIVGATVASLFPSHPVIAFFAGFFSHYILDSIPHWDYEILSVFVNPNFTSKTESRDEKFYLDILRIGVDILLGLLLVLIIWWPIGKINFPILLLGVVGGVLPDFLLFIYGHFPHHPMVIMQNLHHYIHAQTKIRNVYLGVFLQVIIATFVVLFVKYLIKL